jgi:hypothetical protein
VSLSERWHRLEAARWVHRLLMLEVVVLVLVTAVDAIGGLLVGAPLMWLFPGALTALAAWVTSAWGEERRWSWWVVMALTVLGAASSLLTLASGFSWWRAAVVVLDAVFVVLLVHPDSSARLDPRPSRAAEPRWTRERTPRG